MASFYADEDIALELVRILRERGHLTEYSLEVGHAQRPDAFHLRHAASNGATVITGNRNDVRLLHRLWSALEEWGLLTSKHAGILTVSRDLGWLDWADAIEALASGVTSFAGQHLTYNADSKIWHRDRF